MACLYPTMDLGHSRPRRIRRVCAGALIGEPSVASGMKLANTAVLSPDGQRAFVMGLDGTTRVRGIVTLPEDGSWQFEAIPMEDDQGGILRPGVWAPQAGRKRDIAVWHADGQSLMFTQHNWDFDRLNLVTWWVLDIVTMTVLQQSRFCASHMTCTSDLQLGILEDGGAVNAVPLEHRTDKHIDNREKRCEVKQIYMNWSRIQSPQSVRMTAPSRWRSRTS